MQMSEATHLCTYACRHVCMACIGGRGHARRQRARPAAEGPTLSLALSLTLTQSLALSLTLNLSLTHDVGEHNQPLRDGERPVGHQAASEALLEGAAAT